MAVRIVRLGTPRAAGEGLRVGTVRHPPRGVPKAEHAAGTWYDVWLPELAPSPALLKFARTVSSPGEWARFAARYRRELAAPDKAHLLHLLALLSARADFSVGCYCADEARCHRSVLRRLLEEHGATIVS
jgi:uncharacterized protein YeaO (DUF488 family)